MTPRTLAIVLEGAAWRAQQDVRVATLGAWMSAAFARQKKLPALAKVLGDKQSRKDPPKRQSVAAQADILRALQARLGGVLISKAGV